MKAEKGLALQDIIQGIYEFAMDVGFSAPTRVYFLDQLSQVECVRTTFTVSSGPRIGEADFPECADTACRPAAVKSCS